MAPASKSATTTASAPAGGRGNWELIFREPSGFRLQITNEDSATFAAHAND